MPFQDKRLTLLHIDDEPADRALVKRTLGNTGWPNVTLLQSPNLADGLKQLAAQAVDMILLDMNLPDGEGLELVREVREVAPHIPVVVLSGSMEEVTALQVVSWGAQDFLAKNELQHPGVFARTLRYAMERHRMGLDLERRAQELAEELAQSEIRLRQLFESSTDGLVVADQVMDVVYANPAARRLMLKEGDSLLGRKWDWRTQDGSETEIELRTPDGDAEQIRTVEMHTWRTTWEGKSAHFVSLRDVTERKRAQKALEDKEEQLRQAQKMESLGRLAGGVAHDFNNLLGVIIGYAGLVEEQLPAGPMQDDLKQVKDAAHKAAALTRQLLAFSRHEVVQPRVLDLNQVVRDMEKLLIRTIGEDVKLAATPAAGLWRVKVDPGQMEQVIMNLAVNARDAMPQGGSLAIATSNVEVDSLFADERFDVQPGPYVLLSVSDTGQGMDEDTRERVFEPFFTTKPKDRGTGLGLSTAYGIVKQAGGHIAVYSEVGKGTTFRIYLPATEEQPEARQAEAARPNLGGRGETVLLVEDEPNMRTLLERMLVRNGYSVVAVKDGREAVAQVESGEVRPDMVVTDVIMPGMSGSQLADTLRRDSPELKVLFMSGYTDEIIAHHSLAHEDEDVELIQKPFSERDILTRLRNMLDGDGAS